MPFSYTVASYLPLVSLEKATKKYKDYCEKENITSNFIEDLAHRKIIKSSYFANALYVHPQMFENWLEQHKSKQGRPIQNEGYMDEIDVRKYLEETDKYKNISGKDVKVLFENNLLGTPIYCEKNKRYILESKLNLFYTNEKIFNHTDIVNMIKQYIKDEFGNITIPISDVLGFDIDNIGSLIYRSYIKPVYVSTSKVNNSYFTTKDRVSDCMKTIVLLIDKNAKKSKEEKFFDEYNFKFNNALEHTALIRNRLKPFCLPSKIKRFKQRLLLQDKFKIIDNLKSFLHSTIDDIDINTDLKEFILEIKSLIPSNYDSKIYTDMSKLHKNKVSVSFEHEIEIYEETLLDEKKAF